MLGPSAYRAPHRRPFPFTRVGALAACLAGWLLAGPVHGQSESVQLDERSAVAFGQICARCHVRPGIGVPQVGDPEAWADRSAQGFEVLVRNTILGVGNMPPLGTCGFCTDADFRTLVAFMAGMPREPAANDESRSP